MRRTIQRVVIGVLILAAGLGAIWVGAKYRASPPARGETYRLVPNWPRLPAGVMLGQVSGLDVDSNGNVFVFHRAERVWEGEELTLDRIPSTTLFVLDADSGGLIESWGADMFVMPHGLTIDSDDNIWLTDVGLHQVFKFDKGGNLLMTLGERGVAGDDDGHFNMPTDVAISPNGSFYVSDGYGNSRVVKFSADGIYLTEWGGPGTAPGQFNVPHSIELDSQGRVYIADRGNARIQIFDEDGAFIEEWKESSLGRPWAVRIAPGGDLFIVDGGDQAEFWPDRARILKLNFEGRILASFGSYGKEAGQFIWPHAISIGTDGELYIGEVATGMRIQKFTR